MEKLGIQPIQLLLQVINFMVLLFVLKKFLYQPILKMIETRKKKIDEGLEYSDKIKREFEKSEKKRDELVAKGRQEAHNILEEAKKTAKREEAEILEKAQSQAQDILAKARRDSQNLKEELEKDLNKKAVDIAEIIIEKVIKSALSQEAHKSLIDRKLKEAVKRN